MHTRQLKALLLPLALILANLLVKGWFLSSNSIAGDEPFTIFHAQMKPGAIISFLATDNNPPLFELILHYWIKLFGISPLSVRTPSLLFSSLTVLYIYRIGKDFMNQGVGTWASLLYIFSNYQILLAHEARTYALLGLITTAAMYYYLKALSPGAQQKRSYLLLMVCNILLPYTHYFGFFVLGVQLMHFLTSRELRKNIKPVLWALGIFLLGYSPNIAVFMTRFLVSSSKGTWVKPPNNLDGLYNMLRTFTNEPVVTTVVILTLLTALCLYLIRNKKVISQATRLILLWFLFPFLFMFGISYWIPMFLDRYLMPASIGFVLLVAMAADSLLLGKWKPVIPAILVGLFIVTSKPNISNKRDVAGTVEKVQELATENTLIYFCPVWFAEAFAYYYSPDLFSMCNKTNAAQSLYPCLQNNLIYPLYNHLDINSNLFKSADKIIYIDAGADHAFPDNGIVPFLNGYGNVQGIYEFHDLFKVYEFIPYSE